MILLRREAIMIVAALNNSRANRTADSLRAINELIRQFDRLRLRDHHIVEDADRDALHRIYQLARAAWALSDLGPGATEKERRKAVDGYARATLNVRFADVDRLAVIAGIHPEAST